MKKNRKFDVLIIGAGVSGSAIARELSRKDLHIGVMEKEEDVCEGTSKANSGIVHAGYDAMPGTLKARLNVEGARLMPELARELDFDYLQNGSLVLCFEEEGRKAIEELYERGVANGVSPLKILEKEEVLALEPQVSDQVICALHAPEAGIVCPFGLNIALAENAADNGVEFMFNTPAMKIVRTENGWLVNDEIEAKIVINAAGVYADEIHNLAGGKPMKIRARKGEYFLLDHTAGNLCSHTLFQLPTIRGKGVLVAPTVHGNLIVGPTAEFIDDKDSVATSAEGLEQIRQQASLSVKSIPFAQTITSFAGLRAVPEEGDFIIEESQPGWIDVAGIESPGLTSTPAIGRMVAGMVCDRLQPKDNPSFNPKRKGFVNVGRLSPYDWNALIEEDPEYGQIICRCETITAGQIRDALGRSVPAVSLDGVKRRVRAGMGRCQGGFCMPKVMELIASTKHTGIDMVEKSGQGSRIIMSKDKEDAAYDR